MRKLVIPIDKWLHGQEDTMVKFGHDEVMPGSLLHRSEDDKRCCLGHYLVACGANLASLSGKATPAELTKEALPDEAKWLVDDSGFSSQLAMDLMVENDSHARQEEIQRAFLEHGVEVEFVDSLG